MSANICAPCGNSFRSGARFCSYCGASFGGAVFTGRYRIVRMLGKGGFGAVYL